MIIIFGLPQIFNYIKLRVYLYRNTLSLETNYRQTIIGVNIQRLQCINRHRQKDKYRKKYKYKSRQIDDTLDTSYAHQVNKIALRRATFGCYEDQKLTGFNFCYLYLQPRHFSVKCLTNIPFATRLGKGRGSSCLLHT